MKKVSWFYLLLTVACLGIVVWSCKAQIGEGDRVWNDMVAPFRKTVDMGGYSLHYIDMGSGEPVLMVHGFADSSYSWHENALIIKDSGYRLIIVDQPGLGRSDIPPEPYVLSIDNQARSIVKLTEHLGLKEFSLIGHSMGGGISLFITVNYPDKVKQAIVIDPVCFRPPGIRALSIPGAGLFASAFGGRWAIKMGLKDAYYDDSMVDDILVDEYSRAVNKPGFWSMLTSLQRQYFSPGFEKMTQSYDEIRKPMLIIWGEEDPWIPVAFGTRLHGKVGSSRLTVIENCGHNPHQECSGKVNPLLVEFLGAGK